MAVSTGVLAYDIADNRRRARVHRLLEAYGLPVQESVFLLELSDTRWAELEQKLLRLVKRDEDDVRVWRLCAACLLRTRVWCGEPRSALGPVVVV